MKFSPENIVKHKRAVAILMTIRNEELYIDLNISYHLDLGFDYIFIADHCSTDGTKDILKSYKDDPRIIIINETNPVFDHAKIVNKLLKHANETHHIDWFLFLDADEFLVVKDDSIRGFFERLEKENIPYATIGWANALFDHTFSDYRCSPVHELDTTKYYYPWPEKSWQEDGHFRKAVVKNHKNIEVVVGGHYVRTENNPEFFGEYHWNPFIIPSQEAKLLHFEFRGKAEDIYKKWERLAEFENDSTSRQDAPWLERIRTIKEYVHEFKGKIEEITKRWFSEHRTFWGTLIPEDRIVYDHTLTFWCRKYFRRKVESGTVQSVCLVRSGYLGDVIMTEPIARFLAQYVPKVSLATEVSGAKDILISYHKVYGYDQIARGEIQSDFKIRLIYELSNNQKSYIQGFFESIGFPEISDHEIPKIRDDWGNIMQEEFILLAPFTSQWEEKKRNCGYEKFVKLAGLLEKEYNTKCVLLEKHYLFEEMMSLIRHCKFFIGNDSGPAIIAQSFNKISFVIFGAVHPKYIHLSDNATPIYDKHRHELCQHSTRAEEIICCEEFCMDRIRVDEVLGKIKERV